MCQSFPLVDEILAAFGNELGQDYSGYRNHVTRVLNFLFAMNPELSKDGEPVVIAAAFHDLGIWTDKTFDYLGPSVRLAREYLVKRGLDAVSAEVEAIIWQHHKLRPYRGPFEVSVEAFRRADLVDVSLGAVRFGLGAPRVRSIREAFPNAGFHRRLLALTSQRFLRAPLHPLPMIRW